MSAVEFKDKLRELIDEFSDGSVNREDLINILGDEVTRLEDTE